MSKLKPTTLNFISNLCAFFITYSINFFLSPYIVEILGEDAYGFVSLATNFTNYISLATVALNSLASRFISIAVFEKNYEKANKYYTSVLIANAIITAILIIPSIIFIWKLEYIINVPLRLITDVKVLFGTIFAGFFVSLFSSLFSVGVFVENKLYLTAYTNAIGSILRLGLTIVLFVVFPARVSYIGAVSLLLNLHTLFWQFFFKKKFVPKLKVEIKAFDGSKIKELLKAGSWSLVGQISGILNTGLDLLIANEFIDPTAMGVLAISATLPGMIQAVLSSVSSSFTPDLTKDYAENDFDKLMKDLRTSIRLMGIVVIVPLAGLTAFGSDFYALWQPTQDAEVLQTLSVLKVLCLTFTASMAAVHEIFVVANKLKAQAIATLVSGVLNIIIVYVLLKTTSLGIFAIAGVSSIIAILRNFVFTFPYAAKCINQKMNVFYGICLKAFFSYAMITTLYCLVRLFIYTPNTWISFIIVCIICGVVGFILNMFLFASKDERKILVKKIKDKFAKKKRI